MPEGRKRILILIAQLRRGGAERQVHELVRRLDRSRFIAEVATFEPGGDYQPLIEDEGVPVAVIRKEGWREPIGLLRLVALLRKYRPHAIHAFLFPSYWRALLAGPLASRPPVIAGVRSVRFWESARMRVMDRVALRRARVVVGNAPAVREHVIRQTGLGPARVRVILNGVDTELFHPGESPLRAAWLAGAPPGARLVGFVGSFREAKDPMLFLEVAGLEALKDPATRFVLVGDGPLRKDLERRARELGLQERLVFAGQRADMPEVMRSLDLLAVTSQREGCCNAILEAMSTGVPCVASAVGGNPDLLGGVGPQGLFPYGDAGAGAAAVRELLGRPEAMARAGKAARLEAVERFSVAAMVRETSALYEEIT